MTDKAVGIFNKFFAVVGSSLIIFFSLVLLFVEVKNIHTKMSLQLCMYEQGERTLLSLLSLKHKNC